MPSISSFYRVTVQQLLVETNARLGLKVEAGKAGLGTLISEPIIQKPGLALTGYKDQLTHNRVLILGRTEIRYLNAIDEGESRRGVATLLDSEPSCLVLSSGLEAPLFVRDACEEKGVPLLTSELATPEVFDILSLFLEARLSPSSSIHGVFLDVLGIGILILGKSGVGKSEAALELVVRGHRLVADDIVKVRRRGRNIVYGSGGGIIRHHMEIRGLGIINIKDLFGISAVRDAKKIELVIELSVWDDQAVYDRLGIDDMTYEVLDIKIPMLKVPVKSGRSIATIIEVAARNQLLKHQGHHSAKEFQGLLNRAIADARPTRFDIDVIE